MYCTPFGGPQAMLDRGCVLTDTPEELAQKTAAENDFRIRFGGKKLKTEKGRFRERGRRVW